MKRKKFFSNYFWICLLLFILNQLLEREGVFIPLVHAYLDDLLCPGIVLGFALFIQQQFTFRDPTYLLPWRHILFFVFWYSLLFEVIFPYWDARHYADLLDVFAYLTGSLIFYYAGNRKAGELLIADEKFTAS